MRFMTGMIIILILIITTAITGYLTIVTYTSDLNELLIKFEKNLLNENWAQIEEVHDSLTKKWSKAQNLMPALVDHAELHDLEITMTRISSLVKLKAKEKIILEIAVAKKLVNNISGQEKLTIRNIF